MGHFVPTVANENNDLGPCIEVPPHRLNLNFTPDPAEPASLRHEVYSLGLFGKPPSRGCIVFFNLGPKQSNKKVPQKRLKMTILDPCSEIPSRRLTIVFTPDPAKSISRNLGMYSLDIVQKPPSRWGLFEKPPSRGFILVFTPGPKELNRKLLHDNFGHLCSKTTT